MARAVFAVAESAPKLIWDMNIGLSRTMGLAAEVPMTVLMFTGAPSSKGGWASCPPRIRMSSNFGTGRRVSMACPGLFPVAAISWISSMTPPSCLIRLGSNSVSRPPRGCSGPDWPD
nr:hypothetical protein [Candidatus Methanomethylophilus sp. 1R26]